MLIFSDGIAAARLAPYPGWEYLRERAHTAWAEWRRNVWAAPRFLNEKGASGFAEFN